jgi:cob(I)alamin adenosyltransferase
MTEAAAIDVVLLRTWARRVERASEKLTDVPGHVESILLELDHDSDSVKALRAASAI